VAWEKSPQWLLDLFAASLPDDPRIERRKMFGMPVGFVNGNLFAGVFQDQIFVRLAPQERAALEAEHGPLPFEPLPGRSSKTYMRLPDEMLEDEGDVAAMLARALRWTAMLPAKVKKAKAR
jgi:TfoX/Sxy family transcriptional regulator of competence genes